MSTIEIEGRRYVPESALRHGLRVAGRWLGGSAMATAVKAVQAVGRVLEAKATPAAAHVKEHAYTIIGFGMFDSAMFVHSLFTGLLVTGISWIVFEWKVS